MKRWGKIVVEVVQIVENGGEVWKGESRTELRQIICTNKGVSR